MFANIIKKFKKEDGQALIELAITLPILIMILCAIIDFGWLFTNQNILDYCSREGARYAIVHSTSTSAIRDHIRSIAPANIANSMVIDIAFSNSTNPRLGDVEIEIHANIAVLTPIVGVFVQDQTMNLDSSCTMKVE